MLAKGSVDSANTGGKKEIDVHNDDAGLSTSEDGVADTTFFRASDTYLPRQDLGAP